MRVLLVCLVLAAALHDSCADNIISDAVEKAKDAIDKAVHSDDQNNKGISNKLYVKFAPWLLDPLRHNSYFALPRTLNGEFKKGESWKITEDTLKGEGISVACMNNDYRVCILVDAKNSTAGLRISVSAADLAKANNAPTRPHQKKNTMYGIEVYSSTIYFVEQDVLKAGGRDMTEDTLTAPNGFFFDTGDSGLRHIPVEEKDIQAPFSKQNCFGGMGRHYFWGVTPDADCDKLDNYFALYNEQTHQLVGSGLLTHGTSSIAKNGRSWFEFLPFFAVNQIAPTSPKCATDYVKKYGTASLHIFLVDRPWRLSC